MLASNSFGQSGGHTVNAQSAERVLINGSNFTLRWNKIKLGQMSFLTRGNTGDIWEIWGKTLGPLKLVKNYYGVATQFFLKGEDLYRLAGNNSGFRENREVNFRSDRLPSIRSFNEKETTRGLTPQNPWGLSSVSPLRLFRRISNTFAASEDIVFSTLLYQRYLSLTLNKIMNDLDLLNYQNTNLFNMDDNDDINNFKSKPSHVSYTKEKIKKKSNKLNLDLDINIDSVLSEINAIS